MKTVAFFNNKGGVGKTSLVYHLAWMFAEMGRRVIAADLDPQANLSGMFLEEERLAGLWQNGEKHTVDSSIAPLFEGTGDITDPHIERVTENIGLLVGDLALSAREDSLSTEWPLCLDGVPRAFRVTTALARLIARAGKSFNADLALVDVGPNLGAINRAALIACDSVVIPLAPDMFSIQGLRNVGPILRKWRSAWKERRGKKPKDLDIGLPEGAMIPVGYIVMRHSVLSSRPVRAFQRWLDRMPREYLRSMEGADAVDESAEFESNENRLAHLKDYRSLMPMAQEVNKPMFKLKPADGAIGGHQGAVLDCREDFKDLASAVAEKCGIPFPDSP